MRSQHGITGLETAIILIAFVVVASVFAFTVLSVGIFSSEESKETIHEGVDNAENTITPRGGLVATMDSVDGQNAVVSIAFNVTKTGQGNAIDLTPPYTTDDTGTDPDASGLESRTIVSYTDSRQHVRDAVWTVDFLGSGTSDYLLDDNDTAEITGWLHELDTGGSTYSVGTGTDGYLATRLTTSTDFSVTLDPDRGASFELERSTPPLLATVNFLP